MNKLDKIYELSNADYAKFFATKKNDVAFILQVLMSNMTILLNDIIVTLNALIPQNIYDQDGLKTLIDSNFKELKKKMKIAQTFDQSVVIDKIYPLIIENKTLIMDLYKLNNLNGNRTNLVELFNMLTGGGEHKNLNKLYKSICWMCNKRNITKLGGKHINSIFMQEDSNVKIRLIIKSIKDKIFFAETFTADENAIIVDNNGYKNIYLIINVFKKVLLSYSSVYTDTTKYEYVIFSTIIDELNKELIDTHLIDVDNESDNDNINVIVDNIDGDILHKYQIHFYDILVNLDLFECGNIDTCIYNVFRDFCIEIDIYTQYKKYIDYYFDKLNQLTLKSKMYIDEYVKSNTKNIKKINNCLYNLLILSERYFEAKLHQ